MLGIFHNPISCSTALPPSEHLTCNPSISEDSASRSKEQRETVPGRHAITLVPSHPLLTVTLSGIIASSPVRLHPHDATPDPLHSEFQTARKTSNSRRADRRVFLLIYLYVDSTVPNYCRTLFPIHARAYPYYRTGFRDIATGRKVRRKRQFGEVKFVCFGRKSMMPVDGQSHARKRQGKAKIRPMNNKGKK